MTKAEDKAAEEQAAAATVDSAPATVQTETHSSPPDQPSGVPGEPRSVTLKSKAGVPVIVTHAAGVNALHFGQGYTVEGYPTVDAAIAYLAGE